MNQTYLVDDEEKSIEIRKSLSNSIYHEFKFKSNLILMDRNKLQQEQQLFKKKHELKLKLKKMKKRTKLLLKNHNWRKFFPEEENQDMKLANSKMMAQSLSETMFNEASQTFEDDLNSILSEHENDNEDTSSIYTDSSFVSTYEIPKLCQQTQLNDQQSKLNLFNYYNENKCNNRSQSISSAAALPQLSCSAFSNSIPFSTSEMFQVMSNCSMVGGGIGGGSQVSKTSSVNSAAPVQKNNMNFVNTLLTANTPVSIKRKQYNIVQGNICASLFKVTKINQPLLSSSSYLSQDDIETATSNKKINKPGKVKFSPVVKLEKLINPCHRLRRQPQSLTFIADLASTSTPTRVSQQPIASTPKMSCHDPLKYHPTHTIRNKSKKVIHQPIKITRRKPSNKLHCHLQISRIETVKSLDNNNIKKRGGSKRINGVKKRKMFASELNLDCLKYTAIQHFDQYSHKLKQNNIHLALNYKHDYNIRSKKSQEAVKIRTSEMANNNHRVNKRKAISNQSLVSSFSSINSCDNCNICNINGIVTQAVKDRGVSKVHRLIKKKNSNSKNRIQKRQPSSSKTKYKAPNFEITLEDLLYAPTKIRNLEPNPSTNSIVRSRQAVNNGTATNSNAASKVYYL